MSLGISISWLPLIFFSRLFQKKCTIIDNWCSTVFLQAAALPVTQPKMPETEGNLKHNTSQELEKSHSCFILSQSSIVSQAEKGYQVHDLKIWRAVVCICVSLLCTWWQWSVCDAQMNLTRRMRVGRHGDDASVSGQQRAPMMMKKYVNNASSKCISHYICHIGHGLCIA